MKKVLSALLVFLLLVQAVALAEKTSADLPQPDEKGYTTYDGSIGMLFDEEGNFIIESLFDESVFRIEQIPEVQDAAITLMPDSETLSIAIMVDKGLSQTELKDIADSVIRRISSCLALDEHYTPPTDDTFGSLLDEWSIYLGVYDPNLRALGTAIVRKELHILVWRNK